MRTRVGRRRREDFDEGSVDDEGDAHDDRPIDLKRASADRVNDQNADRRAEECDDGVYRLKKQRGGRGDADLREDLGREVLDRADAGHLTFGLDHHDKDGAAEVGPALEEVQVGFVLLGVLLSNLGLDEVELCNNVGVVDVAMRM